MVSDKRVDKSFWENKIKIEGVRGKISSKDTEFNKGGLKGAPWSCPTPAIRINQFC